MSREIKFRAWNKWMDEMVDWEELQDDCYHGFECLTDSLLEVMQFTGLADKNGVEIYEGDIIRFSEYEYCEVTTGYIRYCDDACAYCVFLIGEDSEVLMKYIEDDCLIEIIGNIHENPELLKEQQNEAI